MSNNHYENSKNSERIEMLREAKREERNTQNLRAYYARKKHFEREYELKRKAEREAQIRRETICNLAPIVSLIAMIVFGVVTTIVLNEWLDENYWPNMYYTMASYVITGVLMTAACVTIRECVMNWIEKHFSNQEFYTSL